MASTSYVLAQRIAQGGMAEIYLGKAVGEDAFQRIVAIKRILPHYSTDKEFVQMFRNEAHICKRLQHANIVQVYDFREVEGSWAIIMEHVDGVDFRTLLSACESQKNSISVPMALYIIAQTARGLHYSHIKTDEVTHQPLGIIHRDVSPQNILISYQGEVKITDFGIASAEDKLTETRPGVIKGKYSYMSPEQVAAKRLDGRSDIFALAIVLWESLAMKRLFTGKTEVETIRKVQNCEITRNLKDLNKDVTDELSEIVMRGLAKDPKKRFQTAAQFEKALLKYLNSKYPGFSPSDLGDFLKSIHAKKFTESKENKRKLLTKTENRPATEKVNSEKKRPTAPKQSTTDHTRSSREIVLEDHEISQPSISVNSTGMHNPFIAGHKPKNTKKNMGQSTLKPLDSNLHLKPAFKQVGEWRKKIAPFVILSILVVIIFMFKENIIKNTNRMSRKNDVFTIMLETEPRAVQIFFDNVNIQSNPKSGLNHIRRYTNLKRPRFTRKADNLQHVITIKRPGYISRNIRTPKAKPGGEFRSKLIVLRPREKLVQVKIKPHQSKDALRVEIDDNLQTGSLPMTVKNLSKKHRYKVKFSTKGIKGSCSVTFNRGKNLRYTLTINPRAKRLSQCIVSQ